MAKLPVIKVIRREDIPGAPDWIDRLLFALNLFLEAVFAALNKQLTFSENIQSQIKEISFTTTAAYNGTTANFTAITFQRTMPTKPVGLILLRIFKQGGNYSPIEGDIYVDWNEENWVVTIGLIRGLAASTAYTLRVLLI